MGHEMARCARGGLASVNFARDLAGSNSSQALSNTFVRYLDLCTRGPARVPAMRGRSSRR